MLCREPQDAAQKLEDLFDRPFHAGAPETTERFGIETFANFGIGLEVIGPARADSPLSGLIEQQGEGLLTVAFRVERIEEAIEWAGSKGLEITQNLDMVTAQGEAIRQITLAPDGVPLGLVLTFVEDPGPAR